MKQEYSIWLMPSGSTFRKLSRLMKRLRDEHFTPIFEPHVTLTGEIQSPLEQTIAKTELLASQLSTYKIMLVEPDFEDDFYKSIFVNIIPTKDVTDANKAAQELFNQKYEYRPHLSLVYGYVPFDEKSKIISDLNCQVNLEFIATNLHLISTPGRPETWKKIRKFRLKD